jgi:NitT/TauT family transport system substrate-binding protein
MQSRSGWSLRALIAVAMAGLVALAFAACGSSDDSSTAASTGATTAAASDDSGGSGELQTLKVVLFPTTDQVPFYEALNNGIFKKNGLDVQPTQVLDATALTAAVTSGKADIMFQALPTAITARSSGLPLKLVSGESAMPTEGYFEILVPKDSDIKDFGDLQGKKVATIALHGVFDLAARNAIKAAGGDPADMTSIAMAPTDEQAALTSGRVDAIVLNDPFLQAAKADPKIRSLGNPMSTFDYTVPSASAYAMEKTTGEKADALAKFKTSLQEAADKLQSDPAEAAKVIAGYTQLTPDVIKTIGLPDYTTEVQADAVGNISQQMSDFGWIKKPVTADDILWSGAGS